MVTYLRKVVRQGYVRDMPNLHTNVEVINLFPLPSTKKELKWFLQMAGYYQSFGKNYSFIVAPLTV